MSVNRRHFLKTLGVAGVGSTLAGVGVNPAKASGGHVEVNENWMGVLVDLTKCIGCRRCEYACQEAAGFEPPDIQTFEDKTVMEKKRRPCPESYTVINQYENPHDPETPLYNKANCLHCNDPACMSACLVGAFEKQDDGAVVYTPWKCMGCRYCMVACPFQIPTYDYTEPLTPEVRKCNLCAHLVPSKQKLPACVKICPAEVMIYGKRTELLELAHERIAQRPDIYLDHVYGEHEAGGTSWLYISSKPFEETDLVKLDSTAPPRLTETIQHGVFKHFIPPVAWYGLLGAIMYLAKPKHDQEAEEH